MPIRTILVSLQTGDSGTAAAAAAADATLRLGAHLVGVMLVPDLMEQLTHAGGEFVRRVQSANIAFQMPEGGLNKIVRQVEEKQKADVAATRARFAKVLEGVGVPLLEAGVASAAVPSASFEQQHDEPHAFANAALLADLVVLPREMPDQRLDTHCAIDVLFMAGRPVLLVPSADTGRFARHVVIAWNASPQSARAVSRAIPFLERADAVTIIEIIGSHEGSNADDLALYLARQGIRTDQVRTPPKSGESTAQQLNHEAKRVGGDLMVIGGYGHSRVREVVLGSVTEQMIAQAEMPVFINH